MKPTLNYNTLTLVLLLLSQTVNSQVETKYSKGLVQFSNTEIREAYLWLTTSVDGETSLMLRTYITSLPNLFSANDVLWFTLEKEGMKYIADTLGLTPTKNRQFLRVYLEGTFSLLSYETYKGNEFYICDSVGKTLTLNCSSGNTEQEVISEESAASLISLLNARPSLSNKIKKSTISGKSVSSVLKAYHNNMGREYVEFPPPVVSSVFIELSGSEFILNHNSVIDPAFKSGSILYSASLLAGINLFRNKIELSLKSSIITGTIYHDDQIEEKDEITLFYEEQIKPLIISEGINVSYMPLPDRKVQPMFGLGIDYNFFINNKRTLTEETLYHESSLVVSENLTQRDNPQGFAGINIRAGVLFQTRKNNSIRLDCFFNKFSHNNIGYQNMSGFSISFQKKIINL